MFTMDQGRERGTELKEEFRAAQLVTQVAHQTKSQLPDDFIITALREVWAQQAMGLQSAEIVPIGSRASRASRAFLPVDSTRPHALRRTGRARSS